MMLLFLSTLNHIFTSHPTLPCMHRKLFSKYENSSSSLTLCTPLNTLDANLLTNPRPKPFTLKASTIYCSNYQIQQNISFQNLSIWNNIITLLNVLFILGFQWRQLQWEDWQGFNTLPPITLSRLVYSRGADPGETFRYVQPKFSSFICCSSSCLINTNNIWEFRTAVKSFHFSSILDLNQFWYWWLPL